MDAATLRLILLVVGAIFLVGLYLWERHRARMAQDDGRWTGAPAAKKREPSIGFGARGGAQAPQASASAAAPAVQPAADREPAAAAPAQPRSTKTAEPEAPADKAEDEYDDFAFDADDDYDVPDSAASDLDAEEPRTAASAVDAGEADEDELDEGAVDEELLIQLYVVSADEPFSGERILAVADRYSLIPGDMDIFHRHANDDTDQPPLFSMATLHHPGTFPFADLTGFSTRGLTLFAQFDGDTSDLMIFDEMVDTARALADDLGGEVQERGRSPLTDARARELRGQILQLLQQGRGGAASQ